MSFAQRFRARAIEQANARVKPIVGPVLATPVLPDRSYRQPAVDVPIELKKKLAIK